MAADATRLGDAVRALTAAGIDIFHWDIMDGHFVPNMTFGPSVVKALRPVTDVHFDVHLMVTNPEKWIDGFADAGADCITFHVEVNSDIPALAAKLKSRNIKVGLAFNPATPLSSVAPEMFAHIDRILIMTVNPGFGGQAFIDQSDKIRAAAELKKQFPQLDIMVDGGINTETGKTAAQCGATSLVSGSALMNSPSHKDFIDTLRGAA